MGQPVHALVLHGVGTQKAGYSDLAVKRLAAALSQRGQVLYAHEVLWSPVLDRYEEEMLRAVEGRGSSGRPAQRLVVETLADALCYQNRREEILELVDHAFASLRASSAVIFAHSLGGLIATDWLRSRAGAKVDHLFTFGCNLQLFHLGSAGRWDCPRQVGTVGQWTNLFDPEDMLGYPLGAWLPHVLDVRVEVGGLLGGTGLSHIEYFTDKQFWGETIPNLL